MKKILLFLVFALSTFVSSSAFDVGDRITPDVGTQVQVPMLQPQYLIATMDVVTIEIAPVILFSRSYDAIVNVQELRKTAYPVLWIDPGLCAQVSVTNKSLNYSTYFMRIYIESESNKLEHKYTFPVVTTTRHVLFS